MDGAPSRQQRSWGWALAGAATTAAAAAVMLCRPQDPSFELISISLSVPSFRPLAALDVGLTLAVHASNPNVVPVRCGASAVSILYDGVHLGTARLDAACRPLRLPATSCRLLHLPARLDGIKLASSESRARSSLTSCGGAWSWTPPSSSSAARPSCSSGCAASPSASTARTPSTCTTYVIDC
ncbi:hypothetical protein ACP4OV_018368 [Aristida adscensionis]